MTTYHQHPLTPQCAERLAETTHVCVGVSPFNGYYNSPRITSLVDWAVETFPDFHFFVPDEAPAYTFMALGYDEKKARHKARRQGQYVVNKILCAMEDHGIENAHERVVTAAFLRERPRYVELAAEARRHFDADPVFREEVMDTSSWVLSGYLPDAEHPTEEQKLLAVQYFLDELPMFIDTPGILGVERSAFVYHQEVPFLKRLFSDELTWRATATQSFLVLQDEELRELQPAG